MRKTFVVVVAGCALAACPSKKQEGGGSGGSSAGSATAEKPIQCPPGNAVKDGACVVVVTPEKVAVVAQQQTRLDDLARLLDNVETAAAPIELLNGFRQLDQWKQLVAKSDKLKIVDNVVVTLDANVKKLRQFKAGLGETSGRLGNLKGELDRILKEPGNARKIEEVRTQISSQLRTAIEPFAAQVTDTIANAINPLVTQLSDTGDLMVGACAMAKLQGGGAKVTDMCKQAKDVFAAALKFLDELKTKPAQLYTDVTTKLESELETLVDEQAKVLLDTTQDQVNKLLKLPADAGSGSASPGSAAPPPPPPGGAGSST